MLQNFINSLLQIAFDRSRAIAIRSSAVSYLASLAARGSKIMRESVHDIFDRLFAELDTLRAGYEATAKGPDPERYRFYYTSFQACMYMFCFRWRDFVASSTAAATAADDDDDEEEDDADAAATSPHATRWLPGVREAFSEHIHGRVNPLKVCAPELVAMFARVAKALGFLYIYPKLATNRRVRLTRAAPVTGSMARETALSGRLDETALRLEGHYAFEPYLLPCSKKWVEGMYVNFEDIAPPGMLDEDSSDDEAE
jgi:RNA polymerase I-specific transcription initiation factor RRN3